MTKRQMRKRELKKKGTKSQSQKHQMKKRQIKIGFTENKNYMFTDGFLLIGRSMEVIYCTLYRSFSGIKCIRGRSYTPPSWMRHYLNEREPIRHKSKPANKCQKVDINCIFEFWLALLLMLSFLLIIIIHYSHIILCLYPLS